MSKQTSKAAADMKADAEYVARHNLFSTKGIVDTRTDAERAASKAKQAALLALCARPVDEDALRGL